MNSVAVICRIKLDPDELKAVDDLAEQHRQTRDDFIQGVIAGLARRHIKTLRMRKLEPVFGHLRLVNADDIDTTGAA